MKIFFAVFLFLPFIIARPALAIQPQNNVSIEGDFEGDVRGTDNVANDANSTDLGRTYYEDPTNPGEGGALSAFTEWNSHIFEHNPHRPIELETGPEKTGGIFDDIDSDDWGTTGDPTKPLPGDDIKAPPPLTEEERRSDAGHNPDPVPVVEGQNLVDVGRSTTAQDEFLDDFGKAQEMGRTLFDPTTTVHGHDPNTTKPDASESMEKRNDSGSMMDEVESVIPIA